MGNIGSATATKTDLILIINLTKRPNLGGNSSSKIIIKFLSKKEVRMPQIVR